MQSAAAAASILDPELVNREKRLGQDDGSFFGGLGDDQRRTRARTKLLRFESEEVVDAVMKETELLRTQYPRATEVIRLPTLSVRFLISTPQMKLQDVARYNVGMRSQVFFYNQDGISASHLEVSVRGAKSATYKIRLSVDRCNSCTVDVPCVDTCACDCERFSKTGCCKHMVRSRRCCVCTSHSVFVGILASVCVSASC
jgi:hypothetical protein